MCLGVTFSAGGGLKGNNGGKDGGMARMKGWGRGGELVRRKRTKKKKKNRQVVRLRKAETVKKPFSGKKKKKRNRRATSVREDRRVRMQR